MASVHHSLSLLPFKTQYSDAKHHGKVILSDEPKNG